MPDLVTRVVVVDNGSTDRTAEVARGAGAHVETEPQPGYGAACLAGLRWISDQTDPGIVVFLDADHAEGPEQIERLIAPLRHGSADLVLGTRKAADGSMPVHARFGNRLILNLVAWLFNKRYKDLSPFRAARYAALARLEMDDRDWGWTLQMQIRAAVHGLAVAEVPTLHGPRQAGESKISGSLRGSIRAGRKMFWTLYRERFLVPTAEPVGNRDDATISGSSPGESSAHRSEPTHLPGADDT